MNMAETLKTFQLPCGAKVEVLPHEYKGKAIGYRVRVTDDSCFCATSERASETYIDDKLLDSREMVFYLRRDAMEALPHLISQVLVEESE